MVCNEYIYIYIYYIIYNIYIYIYYIMFYGLVSTRLDFSDEMETLKVELKKAGKLDDAPKAVASRNRAGLTNWHGLISAFAHWELVAVCARVSPWKLSGAL